DLEADLCRHHLRTLELQSHLDDVLQQVWMRLLDSHALDPARGLRGLLRYFARLCARDLIREMYLTRRRGEGGTPALGDDRRASRRRRLAFNNAKGSLFDSLADRAADPAEQAMAREAAIDDRVLRQALGQVPAEFRQQLLECYAFDAKVRFDDGRRQKQFDRHRERFRKAVRPGHPELEWGWTGLLGEVGKAARRLGVRADGRLADLARRYESARGEPDGPWAVYRRVRTLSRCLPRCTTAARLRDLLKRLVEGVSPC